jgi:hypothetical protein
MFGRVCVAAKHYLTWPTMVDIKKETDPLVISVLQLVLAVHKELQANYY